MLLLLCFTALPASAKVFHSKKEALELAFPDAERVDRRTFVLSDEQKAWIEARSKTPLESKLVTLYTGVHQEQTLGYAFIDLHTVRTLPEAFMVVLTPDGAVRSLRMLAFYEPGEYQPTDGWMAQFDGKRVGDRLRINVDVHGIAGATLSARAVSGGVRRSLALFELLVTNQGEIPETAKEGD